MDFGIGRADLLKVLAMAMDVAELGASAFLGRFQHLQRLRLVEGINPGRGKQAQYRANHVMVVAIAMQLLQLGLTPERAVRIIKDNQDRVRLSISLAVPKAGALEPAFLYFDPALLTELGGGDPDCDIADYTFHYAGRGTLKEMVERFLIEDDIPRMAIVNVKGTIALIKEALSELGLEAGSFEGEAREGSAATAFQRNLHEWVKQSNPDSLE